MSEQSLIVDWPAWLPRRLLDVAEVADLLNVSVRTIRRMIDEGRLRRVPHLGRLVRIRPEDVFTLITGQQMSGSDNNDHDNHKK
jgi:excisionase family DNA binding protein